MDDAARALLLLAERHDGSRVINIGTGKETTIRELAETIADIVGYEGEVAWDRTRPDGQPRRALDVSRSELELGFRAEMGLREGLRRTVRYYLEERLAAAPG